MIDNPAFKDFGRNPETSNSYDPETRIGTLHAGETEDLYTAHKFRRLAQELVRQEGVKLVLLDFSKSIYIDSTTLGVVISTLKEAQNNNIEIAVRNSMDQKVFKTFSITGLDKMLPAANEIGEPDPDYWARPAGETSH